VDDSLRNIKTTQYEINCIQASENDPFKSMNYPF